MNKGLQIIISAIIWASIILACDYQLEGNEHNEMIRNFLIAGSMAHIFLLSPNDPDKIKRKRN